MSNREWQGMDDKDADALFEDFVTDLPPEDIAANVTPWKKAIRRVLVGMALTTITLNFWCLQYILPTVGMILLLLGFRTLRRENKWFFGCFVLTLIRAACFFPLLILNTTVIRSIITGITDIESAMTVFNAFLILIEFVCFRSGIVSVQKKAGISPHAGGATALIVWYGLMCLLALFRYSGWIIGLLMVIVYLFILRSLYKVAKDTDEAGYALCAAPIKITDRCIVIGIAAFLAAGCACGYLFGGSYPMKWSPQSADEHHDVGEIKAQLSELGFPEYVLDDLSAEDIRACSGASEVVTDVTDEAFNGGRIETTKQQGEDGRQTVFQKTVCDVRELRITGVGVRISGERERWIIFHHFLWTNDAEFYGTEAIQLWPVYRGISEAWRSDGDVTGRVLCDKDGVTYVSDYYSLGEQSYTSNSPFFVGQHKTNVFATFSMPSSVERCRGYVAYPVAELRDGYIISSWFNYTHQQSPFQYPVVTAAEKRMTTAWNNAGAFKTVQDALQFYPTDGGAEPIN